MKRNLYFLFLALTPAIAIAQPTINNALNYSVGATVKNIRCTDIGPGSAGANQTWDFTSLTPVGNGKDTARYWYSAPASNAPVTGANLVERSSDSFYVYIKKSAAQDEVLAVADSSDGNYNLTVAYTNSILFFKRPLTFGMNFTDNFKEQYSVAGFTLKGSGTVTVNVDGYGTLKLPNNQTFNDVLRVEIIQHQSDTSTFPPSVASMDVIRYMWFDANHTAPLLRIDAVDITSDLFSSSNSAAEYLYLENGVNVADAQNQNLALSSTITNSTLYLNGTFEAGRQYTARVYNLSGSKIFESNFDGNQTHHTFDINTNHAAGMYIVAVSEKDNSFVSGTVRVSKQ